MERVIYGQCTVLDDSNRVVAEKPGDRPATTRWQPTKRSPGRPIHALTARLLTGGRGVASRITAARFRSRLGVATRIEGVARQYPT